MIRGLLALLAIAFIGQAQAADLPSSKWSPERAFKARVSAALNMRAHIKKVQLSTMGAGGKRASTFTGPGDLNAYVEAYGTMAYSATTRGSKLVNACLHVTPAACADAFSDLTTGLLILPSPGAILCGALGGPTQCDVHIAYALNGSGHDMSDGGLTASRPPLDPTGVNGHPAIFCNGSSLLFSSAIGRTNNPFTMVVVATRTSPVFFDVPFDSNDNTVDVVFNAGGGSLHFDAAGASPDVSYTEGNAAVIIGTNDGISTSVSINGGGFTGNPTSSTSIDTNIAMCGAFSGTNFLTGYVPFGGYGNTLFSNQAAISAMFATFWNNHN